MDTNLSHISIQNIKWIEKNFDKGVEFYKKVDLISQLYSMPEYIAKNLLDYEIDSEDKINSFLNPSIYFLHPPYLFKDMHIAVNLIKEAKIKNDTVFIFGDSDVDGIVGIKILFDALQKFGIKNIYYSIPENDEPYGISLEKIDKAISKGAKLIITVDNGISNFKEIEYARSKGLKVIITDHHNPQDKIPPANAVVNPKLEHYQYPLCLSGSAVAWKIVEALLFSQTKIYSQYISFFDFEVITFKNKYSENNCTINMTYFLTFNLKIIESISFSFILNNTDSTKLKEYTNSLKSCTFSLGKIYSKDEARDSIIQLINIKKEEKSILVTSNFELTQLIFSILDIRFDINEIKSIEKLIDNESNFLKLLYTYKPFYIRKLDFLYFMLYSTIRYNYPKCINELISYLPYVSIATIADIMPVVNENRYIISKGLQVINELKPEFITNILSSLINISYPLSSYDIIWKISPLLNSPGRFGKGEILLNFFLSKNDEHSLISLKEINDYNIKRTMIVEEIFNSIKISSTNKPIVVIEKEGIEPGLTGLLSARFVNITSKPVIFITKTKNGIYGSMRSKNSFNSFQFLSKLSDFFENFGGHHFAAGFTVIKDKYEKFIEKLNDSISNVDFESESQNLMYYTYEITFDELIDPEFEKWYKLLQPYGEDFKVPLFYTRNISLVNPSYIGRNNSSIKLKVFQDSIAIDAIFFKSKQFFNEIKLNSINSLIYEPYFMQNNTLTLMIQDLFSEN